jgi:hypothetical protein
VIALNIDCCDRIAVFRSYPGYSSKVPLHLSIPHSIQGDNSQISTLDIETVHLIVPFHSRSSPHPQTPAHHSTIKNTESSVHTPITNAQKIGKETMTARLACWRIKRRPAPAAINILTRIGSFLAMSTFEGVEKAADLAGASDAAVVACVD